MIAGRSKVHGKFTKHRGFMPESNIAFSRFKDETQLEDIIGLISNDLSEPYSIYVYRYFIQQW
jgi:hypothetical protein